jgi:hypothetical protein
MGEAIELGLGVGEGGCDDPPLHAAAKVARPTTVSTASVTVDLFMY